MIDPVSLHFYGSSWGNALLQQYGHFVLCHLAPVLPVPVPMVPAPMVSAPMVPAPMVSAPMVPVPMVPGSKCSVAMRNGLANGIVMSRVVEEKQKQSPAQKPIASLRKQYREKFGRSVRGELASDAEWMRTKIGAAPEQLSEDGADESNTIDGPVISVEPLEPLCPPCSTKSETMRKPRRRATTSENGVRRRYRPHRLYCQLPGCEYHVPFRDKHALQSHIKGVHRESLGLTPHPHKCSVPGCSHSYLQLSSLNRHIRADHVMAGAGPGRRRQKAAAAMLAKVRAYETPR